MADKDIILEVRDLKKYFKSPTGTLHAVDGVNFSIRRGETLGLVGESGCGKSTIGRLILGLHQSTSGEILFNGQDICRMNKKQLHDLRKDLQIIFQDPFSSLNPRMSIGEIIGEPLRIHAKAQSRAELDKEVSRLMDVVGLSARLFNAYPHELDGGRRQRAVSYTHLDKPSGQVYYGLSQAVEPGVTGRLQIVLEAGKIISCAYDEIFADRQEEIEDPELKPYYRQSKYHCPDYISTIGAGFNSIFDLLSARVLETQSLTDLTGLPFTEEPKRAKEWDNYLELARRMEDALAADGLR